MDDEKTCEPQRPMLSLEQPGGTNYDGSKLGDGGHAMEVALVPNTGTGRFRSVPSSRRCRLSAPPLGATRAHSPGQAIRSTSSTRDGRRRRSRPIATAPAESLTNSPILRIPGLVVLDTSKYDAVQVHYRFVDAHARAFLRQIPLSINNVSPALEVILMHFYDLIDCSHFARDIKGISSSHRFVSPRRALHSFSYSHLFYCVQIRPQ